MPFLDLSRRTAALAPELLRAVKRALEEGPLLHGPENEAFEREWARYTGRRHGVVVSSGSDAIQLTLEALGIGRGDEVIVPAFTAVPTVAAVCAAGATPVPVDVDEDTAALDPSAAGRAMSERTRALVVVHLYGRPAALPDLGVPIIEDAAHAHGALRGPGGGIAAAYSFYPTKNLGGVGDGGAVVTDDDELAERVRRLSEHGRGPEGRFEWIAGNSRLSEIEAAALRVALRRLDEGNRRRGEIAAAYREAAPGLRWQAAHPAHVHHLCVARVGDREAFRRRMPFESLVHYPRAVTEEPAYARFARQPTPGAANWAAECVSLPCYPEMRDEEVARVCEAIT